MKLKSEVKKGKVMCHVAGCGRPIYAKDRCHAHYFYARAHGWVNEDPADDPLRTWVCKRGFGDGPVGRWVVDLIISEIDRISEEES